MRVLTSVLIAAALLGGCTPLTRTGEEPLSPEEIRLRAIESKLGELSRRQSAVEGKDDSKMFDELRNLRGEIERLRFERDNAERRGKDQYLDLDRRLRAIEGGTVPAVPGVSVPLAAAAPTLPAASVATLPPLVPPVVAAAPIGGNGADEEQLYLRAFESLKAGKYDAAISGFQGLLSRFPQGNFSDNAFYWMGEAQYVKRQYKPALESFSTLTERFPASTKVPDALFKAGLCQVELGQTEAAKALWRKVVKDYPGTNAEGLAKQRLAQTK